MTISSLAQQTILTQNCNKPRNHKIDRITPHYMVWYCTAETRSKAFTDPLRSNHGN